jgi:hypothetical protein
MVQDRSLAAMTVCRSKKTARLFLQLAWRGRVFDPSR